MRLNDISTQITAGNELAQRAQQSATPFAQPSQSVERATIQSPAISNPTLDRQLERAREIANQRLDQNSAQLQQAESDQQNLRATSDNLAELRSILDEASDETLSSEERDALQERFAATLENTAPSRDTAGSDPAPAITRLANLEDLRSLDLRSADRETLNAATETVSASQEDISRRSTRNQLETDELRSQNQIFTGVAVALGAREATDSSEPSAPGAEPRETDPATAESASANRLQRQAQAVQDMIQQLDDKRGQNPLLMPGSLFNLPA